MPDEAISHYSGVINSYSVGHDWIRKELRGRSPAVW